jgi:hypothetical protein
MNKKIQTVMIIPDKLYNDSGLKCTTPKRLICGTNINYFFFLSESPFNSNR